MARFDDTFAPYHPFGSRNLSAGAAGTDVAVLQSVYNLMLQVMNPPQGPLGSPITIDGHYGSATMQAVKNIQSYFGLSVDGIAGPNTFFAFGQGVGSHTTYGGPVYGSRERSVGDSGGDVTILQNRLNCFTYANLIQRPADGMFDSRTSDAVTAFKKDAELNGDTGFPDNAVAGYGFYDATWLYTFAGGRAIESGRNGFDVVYVQIILSRLTYYSGRITGYYDTATRSAVIRFQTDRGLTPDGIVGPVTFYRLGRSNNVPAPSPLPISWPPGAAPQVTVCSVALVSTSTLHPYGVASQVIERENGFESLDVVINGINPPSNYGSFDAYRFTLTDPNTGMVAANGNMLRVSTSVNPADWAGAYSAGVRIIPKGMVEVYPLNTTTGALGPLLFQGNLADCH